MTVADSLWPGARTPTAQDVVELDVERADEPTLWHHALTVGVVRADEPLTGIGVLERLKRHQY